MRRRRSGPKTRGKEERRTSEQEIRGERELTQSVASVSVGTAQHEQESCISVAHRLCRVFILSIVNAGLSRYDHCCCCCSSCSSYSYFSRRLLLFSRCICFLVRRSPHMSLLCCTATSLTDCCRRQKQQLFLPAAVFCRRRRQEENSLQEKKGFSDRRRQG